MNQMKPFKKIVLAGGSGQIGTALVNHFQNKAEEIVLLSRTAAPRRGNLRTLQWNGTSAGAWAQELDGADLLVNLAGKTVNCRYTEKNKKEILDSRVNSVRALAAAIRLCAEPPALWIQASSAAIYQHSDERPATEADTTDGSGFAEEVSRIWERTFNDETASLTGMRKIVLRVTLVLGPTAGVFPRLRNLVRFGLGGRQGDGTQWVSWVHEADVAGMVEWMATHPELEGPFNCGAPEALRNSEFMRVLRHVCHMPLGLPAPAWMLKIGAWVIGTEAELVLKSRWSLPKKLMDSGYVFRFPTLKAAVTQIISPKTN